LLKIRHIFHFAPAQFVYSCKGITTLFVVYVKKNSMLLNIRWEIALCESYILVCVCVNPKKPEHYTCSLNHCLLILVIGNIFLAYETRISASTSGVGKCNLTPPCRMSRVR